MSSRFSDIIVVGPKDLHREDIRRLIQRVERALNRVPATEWQRLTQYWADLPGRATIRLVPSIQSADPRLKIAARCNDLGWTIEIALAAWLKMDDEIADTLVLHELAHVISHVNFDDHSASNEERDAIKSAAREEASGIRALEKIADERISKWGLDPESLRYWIDTNAW